MRQITAALVVALLAVACGGDDSVAQPTGNSDGTGTDNDNDDARRRPPQRVARTIIDRLGLESG